MEHRFTTLQRQCIYYLAHGKSDEETANLLAISVENIQEWKKIPEFAMELERRDSKLLQASHVEYEQPKKRWSVNKKQLVFIFVAIFGLLACVGIIGVFRFMGILSESQVSVDTEIKPRMEQFISYLEQRDISRAYNMFSDVTKDRVPIAKLKELTNGANFATVDQFESLDVRKWTITKRNSVGGELPAGTYIQMTGVITYTNNFNANYTALMRKEEGEWRIINFNIVAPPKKIEEYVKSTNDQ